MATLKSIKNKYLQASDGTALGVSDNADNVALLAFKMQAADSISKFNMVDGFSDAYTDATGVDASGSTNEIRDAADYYSGSQAGAVLNAYTSGSGNWTCPAGVTGVEVLVVAGGGGASGYGGGGGAGGVVYHSNKTVTPSSTYAYSVGAGGTGCPYNNSGSTSGGNSTFDTITALGGGRAIGNGAGQSGGSGAGGNGGYAAAGGAATQGDSGGGTGYGNAGGAGAGGNYHGGGGGGAGAAGTAGNSPIGTGGPGGVGRLFVGFEAYGTTSANVASSGSNGGYFGGGGGGMSHTGPTVGPGGAGGGANGNTGSSTGLTGLANTGGGGGGARDAVGGVGGTGVVIIKEVDAYNDVTLVSNSVTAAAQPGTADIVATYTNGAGTATLNTDLKYHVSRDNGTTYTEATMVSQGTTGGHTLVSARAIDISGQPAGTTMRYKVTTHNQSVSKQTRAQAVSLAWA